MEAENTVEFYYEKLKDCKNPGPILASHFADLYGVPVNKSIIILCNQLIKTFGRFTVFFAFIDLHGSYPDLDLNQNVRPLIYRICSRKFESAHGDLFVQAHTPLDSYLSSIDKELKAIKKRKFKLPTSEGL